MLTVKDSGVGFDPESSSRIFELFVRLGEEGGQASGGLGIGLTIVKSLVEMHGGRVQAQSDGAGQGATFEVRLPLSKEPALPRAPETSTVAIPLPSKRRVLVVDDNVDAAESMLLMLRLDGFDVRTSYDGQQALQVAREFKPAVAFLDLHMPGMWNRTRLGPQDRALGGSTAPDRIDGNGQSIGCRSDAARGLRCAPHKAGATRGTRPIGLGVGVQRRLPLR